MAIRLRKLVRAAPLILLAAGGCKLQGPIDGAHWTVRLIDENGEGGATFTAASDRGDDCTGSFNEEDIEAVCGGPGGSYAVSGIYRQNPEHAGRHDISGQLLSDDGKAHSFSGYLDETGN